MELELAHIIGIVMVFVPLIIWSSNALGFGVIIPDSHFATLVWAGVSLILGYNLKTAGDKLLNNGDKDE